MSHPAPFGRPQLVPSAGRLLVIDDNESIHEDIKKIIGVSAASAEADESADRLASMAAELFGTPAPKPPQKAAPRFEVDSALQGRDGYELAAASKRAGKPYMVAFVDVRMPPGWDGVETVEHIWKVDPDIQIVLCTAYSDHSWTEIAERFGRHDGWLVIKKPFDPIEVLQTAHSLTSKWQLNEQIRLEFNNLEELVAQRTRDLSHLNEQLVKEISERKMAEENLKHLATHDSLTGLANRLLMRDRMEMAIARAARYRKSLACMTLDLDNFKGINDTLGHEAGDRLLQEVATRLKASARASDTVARLGGDEFLVLLGDLHNDAEASVVAERVLQAMEVPVQIRDRKLKVTCSIGISVFGRDAESAEGLLKCADFAMYEAKQSGKAAYRFYTTASEVEAHAVGLNERLALAEANNEFVLHYQPLVDVASGAIVSMEALLRWYHPENGVIMPDRFIPAAEQSGRIVTIGRWVLAEAARQNAEWQRAGYPPVSVAVNMSACELHQPDLPHAVMRALADAQLPPRYLEVEVTETAAMRDIEMSAKNLGALYEMGCRIVIDDFGAGYSSMQRIKTLPVHVIKIDRLFTQNIVDDKRDAAIVTAIIAMARSLGIQVVAEGIERPEQLDFLRNLQWTMATELTCDRAQGFYFSRPCAAEEAGQLLQRGIHVASGQSLGRSVASLRPR